MNKYKSIKINTEIEKEKQEAEEEMLQQIPDNVIYE